MKIALDYAARSDVGLVRSENQDSGMPAHLLVVADGMGGHAGGDIAGSIAIGTMVTLDGESHGGDDATDHLSRTIAAANAEIQSQVDHSPELQGMGTTVTALLRAGNKVALAHIGDSRAYLLRGEKFNQITHDHSFVQSLVDEGRITEEEADSHPQRSLVTRVLTGSDGDEPDLMVRSPYRRPVPALLGRPVRLRGQGHHRRGALGRTSRRRHGRPARGLAMRAGAPDNVTVVVADIVDLDSGATPRRSPRSSGRQPTADRAPAVPVTPQRRRQRSREVSGDRRRRGHPRGGSGRLGQVVGCAAAVALLALIVLGGGGAAYDWASGSTTWASRTAMSPSSGAFPRTSGRSGSPASRRSSIQTADLPDFYRNRVENTVSTSTLSDAHERRQRTEAVRCVSRKAAGGSCGTGVTATTPVTDDQQHDDRPHPDDDALGRRDERAMTTVSSLPPRQGRNVELSLLLLAVGIVVIAYLNVGLATQGSFPPGCSPTARACSSSPWPSTCCCAGGRRTRIPCSCRSSRSSTASAW